MKMELIEGSETSAISTVTPGNYKKNMLRIEHGESLKSRIDFILFVNKDNITGCLKSNEYL